MFGLLNLNKPKGLTSRDAVNRAQRITGKRVKVGHAGTLDPIATGVLVVCLGPATRLIEHVQRMPKRYRGTFLLGCRSPSDDVELEPKLLTDPPIPTREQVEAALPAFVGDIQQVPPAYSAIKLGGQKAYDLARRGDAPDLPPRPVTIHAIGVARYEYPELVLDIHCGSGTYIRSLGRDLAAALGTAAVMSELERTAIGEFRVEDAVDEQPRRTAIVGSDRGISATVAQQQANNRSNCAPVWGAGYTTATGCFSFATSTALRLYSCLFFTSLIFL